MLSIPRNVFNKQIYASLSPAQLYLKFLTQKGGINAGSEIFITLDEFMRRAIRANRKDLIEYATKLGFNHWNIPLEEYARQGNKELVDYYLKIHPIYYTAAIGALKGDHRELFDYINSITPSNYYMGWSSEYGYTRWN
jgi:hypothetical protein